MKWTLLFIGILAELLGTTCMKLSEGFTKIYPSILTFVFWIIALSTFLLALKKFDLSFAYAFWTGLGIIGVSLIGIIHFKEPYNLVKIIALVLIMIGIIILNVSDIYLNKK